MSSRVEQLADELQQVTDEVTTTIETTPDAAWQNRCEAEQCTVAALAFHIADSYSGLLDGLVKPIVDDRERPRFSPADLARWNAAAAKENATQPKAVVLQRLQTQAPSVIAYVRALRDADLQRTGPVPMGGDPMTAEAVITYVLIGHPRGHLASIQAATT